MAEVIYSEPFRLTVLKFQALLQHPLQRGFPTTTGHTWQLVELTTSLKYVIGVKLYPDEQTKDWLDQIDLEWKHIGYDIQGLWGSPDPDDCAWRNKLYHKLELLKKTRQIITLTPIATIEAYQEPAGIRIEVVDHYSPYERFLCRNLSYTPLIRPALIQLAAHIQQIAHAAQADLAGREGILIEERRGASPLIKDLSLEDEGSPVRDITSTVFIAKANPDGDEEMPPGECEEEPPLVEDLPLGGYYGTCRDIPLDDVRKIVKRCLDYKKRGGKIAHFYERQNIIPGEPRSYYCETLRGWLKRPKFHPKDCKCERCSKDN